MIDDSHELTLGELDAVNGGAGGALGLMGGDGGAMAMINQIMQMLQQQRDVLNAPGQQQG